MTAGLVRVAIGTTEGPSVVQRIAPEDRSLAGVVCLDRGTEALPISGAYDAFVRAPTGVVERLVGHPVFRVDVSARIETGESWQLGLLLAHRLSHLGRLAEGGAPAAVTVWTTGTVTHERRVGPVDRVDLKLARSTAFLERRLAAGERVVVLAATADAEAIDRSILPPGVEVIGVDDGTAALDAIIGGSRWRRPWRFPVRAAAGGLAIVALAVLFLAHADRRRDAPVDGSGARSAVAPVRIALTVDAVGIDGGLCVEPRGGNATAPVPLPDACRIAGRVENVGTEAVDAVAIVTLAGGFSAYVHADRFRVVRRARLAPGEALVATVDAPRWVRRAIVARATAGAMLAGTAVREAAVRDTDVEDRLVDAGYRVERRERRFVLR